MGVVCEKADVAVPDCEPPGGRGFLTEYCGTRLVIDKRLDQCASSGQASRAIAPIPWWLGEPMLMTRAAIVERRASGFDRGGSKFCIVGVVIEDILLVYHRHEYPLLSQELARLCTKA